MKSGTHDIKHKASAGKEEYLTNKAGERMCLLEMVLAWVHCDGLFMA